MISARVGELEVESIAQIDFPIALAVDMGNLKVQRCVLLGRLGGRESRDVRQVRVALIDCARCEWRHENKRLLVDISASR
jgi:hypothetical protein